VPMIRVKCEVFHAPAGRVHYALARSHQNLLFFSLCGKVPSSMGVINEYTISFYCLRLWGFGSAMFDQSIVSSVIPF